MAMAMGTGMHLGMDMDMNMHYDPAVRCMSPTVLYTPARPLLPSLLSHSVRHSTGD
jgi:hypothetical protein